MDDVIRVSAGLSSGSYVNQAKRVLQSKATVELHAVGLAIPIAFQAALRLEELKYVSSSSFITQTVASNDNQLHKVIVTLTKSPGFDRVHEEFIKSKQVT